MFKIANGGPAPPPPGSEFDDGRVPAHHHRLERAVEDARDLLEAALTQSRGLEGQVQPLTDERAVRAATVETVSRARRSVQLTVPDLSGCLSWNRSDHPIRRLVESGIQVRQLYSEHVRRAAPPETIADLLRRGSHVRVARTDLHRLVIVDSAVAILKTDLGGRNEALLVRSPALLRTLEALFAASWESGVQVAAQPELPDVRVDDLSRRILGYLCSGYTDTAAARNLGLSVRTYRRRVAELMRRLDVQSRFQAGARAVQLQLVDIDGGAPPAKED